MERTRVYPSYIDLTLLIPLSTFERHHKGDPGVKRKRGTGLGRNQGGTMRQRAGHSGGSHEKIDSRHRHSGRKNRRSGR